jgi:small nuclear ribonucleoprotein (snRNP)-like protein
MERRNLLLVITVIAVLGVLINYYVQHYQGGEIYEAANHAYGLLVKGYNVTITLETVDGETVRGTLLSVQGSTINIVSDGKVLSVGGPSATKEDLRARLIKIDYHGKVYVYELPPRLGKMGDIIDDLEVNAYSERFSGIIYIDGNITPIRLGMLKYTADYLSYGSVTINQIDSNGAIISVNMVPLEFLREYLGDYKVYLYGLLYVNSEERNLPLKLVEVRTG